MEALARQFQDQIERIMMEKGRGVEKSYIPSRNEREVNEFKKLNREKSFDEARTAVQSQIEKIFQKVRNIYNYIYSIKFYKYFRVRNIFDD